MQHYNRSSVITTKIFGVIKNQLDTAIYVYVPTKNHIGTAPEPALL